MQQQIDGWLKALCDKANADRFNRKVRLVLERGHKYTKVVKEEKWDEDKDWGSRSVHAFIDNANGDIYKAATWKAPAKNGARFNVVNDFDRLIEVCDIYGSYLYKR